jgi:hypothetical protein
VLIVTVMVDAGLVSRSWAWAAVVYLVMVFFQFVGILRRV